MKDISKHLIKKLKLTLPREKAWNALMPEAHSLNKNIKISNMTKASVLIALYANNNELMFPLIKRVTDGHVHSGQISFPGGKLDPNETPKECAIREAFEEVGIDAENINIIGELSTFPIHVSNYLVYPFVALLDKKPEWIPQPDEVEAIFEIKLSDINDSNIHREVWSFSDKEQRIIPYYLLNNEKVWGATAMILSELQMLINN